MITRRRPPVKRFGTKTHHALRIDKTNRKTPEICNQLADLSRSSKIVPIKMAYLRYAVCGCCLCIKNANCYILQEGCDLDTKKPLPLGEVAPQVTERAGPSQQSRHTAISRPLVRARRSLRPTLLRQHPCPLRRFCASSPKGRATGRCCIFSKEKSRKQMQ